MMIKTKTELKFNVLHSLCVSKLALSFLGSLTCRGDLLARELYVLLILHRGRKFSLSDVRALGSYVVLKIRQRGLCAFKRWCVCFLRLPQLPTS